MLIDDNIHNGYDWTQAAPALSDHHWYNTTISNNTSDEESQRSTVMSSGQDQVSVMDHRWRFKGVGW